MTDGEGVGTVVPGVSISSSCAPDDSNADVGASVVDVIVGAYVDHVVGA